MFAYCKNNPIIFYDNTGDIALSAILPVVGKVLLGTLIGGGTAALSSLVLGKSKEEVFSAMREGAITAALVALSPGTAAIIDAFDAIGVYFEMTMSDVNANYAFGAALLTYSLSYFVPSNDDVIIDSITKSTIGFGIDLTTDASLEGFQIAGERQPRQHYYHPQSNRGGCKNVINATYSLR